MSDHSHDRAEPQVGPDKPGDEPPKDDEREASRVPRGPQRKAEPVDDD